jgi:hypothetical protein
MKNIRTTHLLVNPFRSGANQANAHKDLARCPRHSPHAAAPDGVTEGLTGFLVACCVMRVPNYFEYLISADHPWIFRVRRVVLHCRWASLSIEPPAASDHPLALPSLPDVLQAFFDLVRQILEVLRIRAAFHFLDKYVNDFVILTAMENRRLPLRRLEALPESDFFETLRVLQVVI